MSTQPIHPAAHTPSFEAVWGDLGRGLENVLVADGVPGSLAEDVVQETGIRLLVRWEDLDHGRPLMPLALTIARNLVVDRHRKEERIDLYAVPQERPAPADIEQRALARIHLGAVHRALQSLNPRYRKLLLIEAGYLGEDPSSEPATRAARSRARRGLKLLMEHARDAAWVMVGPIGQAARKTSVRLRSSMARPEWAAVGQAFAGVALFVVTFPPGGSIPSTDAPTPWADRTVTMARGASGINLQGSHLGAQFSVAPQPGGTPSGKSGQASPSYPGPLVLGKVPHSQAEGESRGRTSLHRIEESGEGGATLAGEQASWRYEVRYRSPGCVRKAANGKPTTACDATPEAEGSASVRYGEHEVGYETGE